MILKGSFLNLLIQTYSLDLRNGITIIGNVDQRTTSGDRSRHCNTVHNQDDRVSAAQFFVEINVILGDFGGRTVVLERGGGPCLLCHFEFLG